MIPTSMFLAVLFVSIAVASVANFALGRYIERRRNETKLNVFDAYSDDDMDRERRNTANTVRKHHGSSYYRATFDRAVIYLAAVDREIARRKVLEQSNISQTMRELAAFDTVYTALESGQKEKK